MTAFPETKKLKRLRAVQIASMKRLRDFRALARALEEFVIQNAEHQRPDDFAPLLRCKTLKRAGFGFFKKADVARMTELCAAHRVDGKIYRYPQLRGDFDL